MCSSKNLLQPSSLFYLYSHLVGDPTIGAHAHHHNVCQCPSWSAWIFHLKAPSLSHLVNRTTSYGPSCHRFVPPLSSTCPLVLYLRSHHVFFQQLAASPLLLLGFATVFVASQLATKPNCLRTMHRRCMETTRGDPPFGAHH